MTSPDANPRIITVKGRRYIVSPITPAADHGTWRVTVPYVSYWSERDGKPSGATRMGTGIQKPGTVGRAVWDAVQADG